MANVKDLLVNGSARVIGTIYGNATSANKLNTNAGSASQPVYFSNGIPVAITSTISNNAATATKLATARTINGTPFDGSANITTANWGTARTLTIGNIGKSVNGSGNVSWSLSEIGAAASSHNHTSLTGVTSISFNTNASDAASITTVINASHTYFDFMLADDLSHDDEWRWRFTPSGGTIYDAMKLSPTSQGKADLYVGGTKVSLEGHTHNYAGSSSAGGAANSANKLTTARTISLTGSVTGSGTFDGSGNLSITTTTNHNHDSNYLQYSGFWDSSSGQHVNSATGMVFAYGSHGLPGAWGVATTFEASKGSNYRHQIYGDGLNNEMYFRTCSSDTGGWNAWRHLLDSSNYTSYTVTKTGSGASGIWGINISGKAAGLSYYSIDDNLTVTQAKDQIRSKLTNKGIAAVVLGSSYIDQWNTDTASYYESSVHSMIALNPGYDNTTYGHFLVAHYGDRDLCHIGVDGNNWGRLRTLLDSANYTYYTVTKTGSGASGTWGINITGSAATSANANSLNRTRSIGGSSHANALSTEFSNNKTSIPRDQLLTYYSSAYGNGSFCMGYFLSGYDSTPYGGFFVAHYDTPYYVGISYGRFTQSQLWKQGDSVTGAVWNDYAEYREADTIQGGRCVREVGDDTLALTTKRLMRGCSITSDTWGFAQGETDKAKTPIAVAGRVLAYPLEDRELFKEYIGYSVCSGPDGTVSIMTEEEELKYPWAIVGTVSAVPDYEEWGGGEMADRPSVKVDGRIWIKVK